MIGGSLHGGCVLGYGWTIVSTEELGSTAQVFAISNGRGRLALKAVRSAASVAALQTEHRVLRTLAGTAMGQFVPMAGPWLSDLNGFTMTWLRYPTAAEKASASWIRGLAYALRTLHGLPVPAGLGLPDDRPTPGTAYGVRVREALGRLTGDRSQWRWLGASDRPWLDRLRDLAPAYAVHLPRLEAHLDDEPATLTHGDLAGDNLMAFADGSPALADWGMARIGARLAEVASLAIYAEWDDTMLQAFLEAYAPRNRELEAALGPMLALTRFMVCLHSLDWINRPPGQDGLDAVGRAFFARQMAQLTTGS